MKCNRCTAAMFWQSTREQWFCLNCRSTIQQAKPSKEGKKDPRSLKEMSLILQLARKLDEKMKSDPAWRVEPKPTRHISSPDMVGRCPSGHPTFYQERHERFYCLKCRRAVKENEEKFKKD